MGCRNCGRSQAKDCFREFYTQHLAKRLLLSRSASMDAEKGSVSKLKKLCGPAYTAKIEGMITDLGVGQGIEQVCVREALVTVAGSVSLRVVTSSSRFEYRRTKRRASFARPPWPRMKQWTLARRC